MTSAFGVVGGEAAARKKKKKKKDNYTFLAAASPPHENHAPCLPASRFLEGCGIS